MFPGMYLPFGMTNINWSQSLNNNLCNAGIGVNNNNNNNDISQVKLIGTLTVQ